ncbi:MAG: hypothetical protein H6Q12_510 [Bacteroidetes bacterium]|nr:hypothetical protein [Bacteroidota bacterium]
MIIKLRYIGLLIALLTGLYGCGSQKEIQQQAIKDIDGRPISFLLKNDRVIYYSVNGEKKTAYSGGVEFNSGRESLSEYLLSKYVNHPDYNYNEYNVYEYMINLKCKSLYNNGLIRCLAICYTLKIQLL